MKKTVKNMLMYDTILVEVMFINEILYHRHDNT